MTQHTTSYQGNRFLLYLRSALLFIAVLLITWIVGPLIVLAIVLPYEQRYKVALFWSHCVIWAAKYIAGIDYQVTGQEHIPTDRNGVVLCKHQSAWETIFLMTLLPPQSIVLKRSLLLIPIWGTAVMTIKPISINRGTPKEALAQIMAQGARRLKEGLWVVVYPEGTRVAPGEERKFNGGGSLLARSTQSPVLPIAHNAGEYWPRNSFVKYPGVIQVKIGPVIESTGRKSKDVNAEAEAWIRNAMQDIAATK